MWGVCRCGRLTAGREEEPDVGVERSRSSQGAARIGPAMREAHRADMARRVRCGLNGCLQDGSKG